MHLIYITFPSRESALKAAHELVKARLIACANINNGITSIYEWEGEIKEEGEFSMVCKTTDALVSQVIEAVRASHPHTCPGIVSIKIDKANEDFVKWVETSCKVV